jgi:hypothetical protein
MYENNDGKEDKDSETKIQIMYTCLTEIHNAKKCRQKEPAI